jgi:hypothetical protein
MTIVPFAVAWVCLVAGVIGLAGYRKLITRHEDDYLHVDEAEAKAIPGQIATAHKLDTIDRWEKLLLIVTVATGVVLGAVYLYQLWQRSLQPVS